MTTIEITTRRTIVVPEADVVRYDEDAGEWWAGKVNLRETAEAFLVEGEDLSDVYTTAELVVAPDPDELEDYNASLVEFERAKAERDMKLLAGALPEDLPTDEQLREDIVEEEPTLTAVCGNCGSNSFDYREDVGYYSGEPEVDIDDNGLATLTFHGSKSSEGTGYPGLVCESCEAMLDVGPHELEWGY